MSFIALAWAVEAKIIRPTAKLALVCLANYSDEKGYCFPSQKALAAKVGVTDRALRTALKWLEVEGHISRKTRTRKDGSRTSDGYQLPEDAFRKNLPATRKSVRAEEEDSSDLTSFEPVIEAVISTAASENGRIQSMLFQAAGIGEPPDAISPALQDLGPIRELMAQGYHLDRHVLPVVRAKNRNGFRPRSWKFYVDAIREAGLRAGSASIRSSRDVDWDTWCTAYYLDGTWKDALGPKPDEPGCLAPETRRLSAKARISQ